MKQIVIIKESQTLLHVEKEYLLIKKQACSDNIIAYRYIKKLYINKLIDISLNDCLKLASHFELYFINQHGHILARLLSHEKI